LKEGNAGHIEDVAGGFSDVMGRERSTQNREMEESLNHQPCREVAEIIDIKIEL
jgi:hypothetical protein